MLFDWKMLNNQEKDWKESAATKVMNISKIPDPVVTIFMEGSRYESA